MEEWGECPEVQTGLGAMDPRPVGWPTYMHVLIHLLHELGRSNTVLYIVQLNTILVVTIFIIF